MSFPIGYIHPVDYEYFNYLIQYNSVKCYASLMTNFTFESRLLLVKILIFYFFFGGGKFVCYSFKHHGQIFSLRSHKCFFNVSRPIFFFLIYFSYHKTFSHREMSFHKIYLKNAPNAVVEQESTMDMF